MGAQQRDMVLFRGPSRMLKSEVEGNAWPREHIRACPSRLWRNVLSRERCPKELIYPFEGGTLFLLLDKFTPLVRELRFPKIHHLDQPQSLIGPIETQSDTILGKGDDNWGCQRAGLRIAQFDRRILRLVLFHSRQNLLQRRPENLCLVSIVGKIARGWPTYRWGPEHAPELLKLVRRTCWAVWTARTVQKRYVN